MISRSLLVEARQGTHAENGPWTNPVWEELHMRFPHLQPSTSCIKRQSVNFAYQRKLSEGNLGTFLSVGGQLSMSILYLNPRSDAISTPLSGCNRGRSYTYLKQNDRLLQLIALIRSHDPTSRILIFLFPQRSLCFAECSEVDHGCLYQFQALLLLCKERWLWKRDP